MPEDQSKSAPDAAKPAQTPPAGDQPAGTNISPSVTDVTGEKPAKPTDDKPKGDAPAENSGGKVRAEPLEDGTVPTVLKQGESHRSVAKRAASITNLYRKADITTTVLTFVTIAVAGLILIAAYTYFTNSNKKATPPPKVTSLSASQLKSLNDFFAGNSSGASSQILNFGSPSLFTQRVGVSSDMAVTGGVTVSGPTSLGQLVVDQNSTLGVVDIRGALTVSGPTSIQNPLTVTSDTTVKGNLQVGGAGSFGGSLSAASITVNTLSVTGTLNLDNNITIGGSQPTATPAGVGTSVLVQGNDSAGQVTVSTSTYSVVPSDLVTITFHTPFNAVPVVTITPTSSDSAAIEPYVTATATGFTIAIAGKQNGGEHYSFNYWVVGF